ncbi:polymorphic toxin-type HINT domain-containing protein [Streptomyces sp. NPDC088348]|uniref:polymorphic toxin-type HINT domain-containing protein n=1 Tax=Streptomyces sp. NPDC088348 TaxID=3365853 RepID=UPI00382A11F5
MSLAAALIGTLLQGAVTPAAEADDMPKVPASEKALSGHGVKMKPRPTKGTPRTPEQAPKRAWPKATSTVVTLHPKTRPTAAQATGTPVSLSAPVGVKSAKTSGTPLAGAATVRVLDHGAAQRAGVDGMLFSLARKAGATGDAVGLTVDYSAFAQAYGGAYADRVKLVKLPACAATTPKKKACTNSTPVPAVNNQNTHVLTARSVSTNDPSGVSLFAVAAGTSSDHGDYGASSLSPSAAWDTSLNTGDFSWSYDLPSPAVPGDFTPAVKLSYSSNAVDGRTSNTNNQSSWAGDGFSLWSGSIERSYKQCADDGVKNADGKKPGDLCWAYDNATLSFNGHSGELIPTGTDTFKIKGDDGTKVQRLYGSSTDVRDNGARKDEYWVVTTPDGSRYYFGYNKLPGWSAGDETTDSTWTVPVYGNNTDEPCHASSFADSWCQQAWRWNLDYAVDARGNAITYYYDKETNYYARNLKAADETVYDRGGSLDRIEYGLTSSTVYSKKPLARVDFDSAERCVPETGVTCEASTIGDKSFYWYDTPWDLNCKSGADCTKSVSPSFWSRKRLAGVTTQVLKPDSTGYSDIDSWDFEHGWGMADTDYQLELKSIQHTGKSAASSITLPKVTFTYDQRANRLDVPGDDTSPFIKERLSTVVDESGGQLDVTYSTAACDADHLPVPESNTSRCYPVYYTKPGAEDPTRQWFNKYVVDAVTQTDRTQSSPDMVTRYSYLDGAAWHYDDDDGLTKEKYKTWSSWRGYGHVRVQTGGQDPVGMKSQADHYFLRGMDGDKDSLSSSTTKSVTVPDDNGGTITDHASAAGFEYKTEQYSGPGGKVLTKSVNTPWHFETAKRVRDWGTTTANLTGTLHTWSWTSLDNGAGSKWRKTYVSYSHEKTAGRITQAHDAGDSSIASDDTCTRTTYVDNTKQWILNLPTRVEVVTKACTDTPDRSKDVVSDVRTAYDGQAYGAAPTKGDATHVAILKSHDGTTATYTESGATYDTQSGRILTATDITGTVTATESTAPVRTNRTDGHTTTTAYTPASGFPTEITVTGPPATPGNAATAQSSTTTYDTLRGSPLTVLDTNRKRTDTTYDSLGRRLRIWLPDRSKANSDIPNYEFVYGISDKNAVSVATKTLKSDSAQQTSYTLYDGSLRPRQVQAPGPGGGRLVSDTFYDERGLTAKTFAPYYNTQAPAAALLKLDDALAVETQEWNTYDGLGRATRSQEVAGNSDGGKVLATTSTTYGGDRTTVTPPQGATPTTTVTDARGRTTDLLQYHATNPAGVADTTHYAYTPTGKLAKVTDPAGNEWTYTYDQRGNQITTHDPDKGVTSSHYDDRDQIVSVSDDRVSANGDPHQTITHLYDGLGRETETHDGSATGPVLTKHTWDPAGAKGQLASTTRYVGGAGGDAYTTTYNIYDTLYRPNRVTTTIPSVKGEEALAGAYQNNIKYNANGTVQSTGYPAAGSLAADALTPAYDDVLRPTTLSGSGGTGYISGTTYSYTGKPLQFTYQSGGKKTQATNTYQWGTQRLENARVDREDVPGTDKSSTYGYDDAGNVQSISDVSRDGTDNQCFQYDYLNRLTEAWAQSTRICGAPGGSVLGGPAPYWQSYTYDLTGNRKTETLHDQGGDPSKDTHRTYSYPDAKSPQPHTLSGITAGGPEGAATTDYTYDPTGNTASRTEGATKQSMTWDAEGHLAKVVQKDGSGTKTLGSYVYDADGNRLIARTPTGTTLYLGATELTLAVGATKAKATRYYDLGGGNQAVRTDDNKLTFLIGDHHGTSELAIGAADLSMRQRRSTPFGSARGAQPAGWPGTKGFVGGTKDADTGLTHLGAREYDPTTGRFISVDPLLDPSDPQSLNGYSYSHNTPVSNSDPTGLSDPGGTVCGITFPCQVGDRWANGKGPVKDNSTPVATPITRPGDWENEGSNAADFDHDGYINVYPLVKVRATWKPNVAKAFIATFYDRMESLCHGLGGLDCEVEHPDEYAISVNAAFACKATRCPDSKTMFSKVIKAGMKEVFAFGPGEGRIEGGKGKRAGRAKFGCGQCFLADTRVLMADGEKKKIEDVKVGDEVEATDPETGKSGHRKVTRLIVTNDDKRFNTLSIATKSGTEKITATYEHPFWSPSEGRWTGTAKLKRGMTLLTDDGSRVTVTANHPFVKHARTYNLTVEGLHTYYVLAGATPVLVHNSSCPRFIADSSGNVIELPQVKSSISSQKQGRHIIGGRGYKGGGYFNSEGDAQAVLDAYHSGTAQVMGITKTGNIQIRVPSVVGYDNNPAMNRLGVPTNIFMIKGTKSPSVVPMNPQAGAP